MAEHKNREEKFDENNNHDQESDARLDQEIKAGEWTRLREFATYRKRSRQGKIIATHQAISNRLAELEKLFYELVRNHPQRATRLLKEIKRLRYLKEYLLQALIWEEQGELEDHDSPEEFDEII